MALYRYVIRGSYIKNVFVQQKSASDCTSIENDVYLAKKKKKRLKKMPIYQFR